jgi:membrane protein CcdC involved in cytochrome C biogenesis
MIDAVVVRNEITFPSILGLNHTAVLIVLLDLDLRKNLQNLKSNEVDAGRLEGTSWILDFLRFTPLYFFMFWL